MHDEDRVHVSWKRAAFLGALVAWQAAITGCNGKPPGCPGSTRPTGDSQPVTQVAGGTDSEQSTDIGGSGIASTSAQPAPSDGVQVAAVVPGVGTQGADPSSAGGSSGPGDGTAEYTQEYYPADGNVVPAVYTGDGQGRYQQVSYLSGSSANGDGPLSDGAAQPPAPAGADTGAKDLGSSRAAGASSVPSYDQWMAESPSDRVNQAMQYYLNKGLSKTGAAYMVGSLYWESQGLVPDQTQNGGGPGPGVGFGQWTDDLKHHSFQELQNFATRSGQDWTDPATQLNFALQQRINVTAPLWTKNNPSLTGAQAQTVIQNFENYAPGKAGQRYVYAQRILKNLDVGRSAGTGF